ncbi:hypothetical protein RJD24_05250 [Bacillaceae bacterium IKA-2]|nr:hypothetical protein RJD24_05250 [Bacillaceae bacterium IKA-2]
MVKNKQKQFLLIVITALLMSFSTAATIGAEETNDKECSHMEKIGYEKKAIRPHFNFYYQLLAEKYAPNHVKVWNEVIQDREALHKQFKELKKSGKELDNFYDEAWLKEHGEIHQVFLEAVEKRDDAALKELVPRVIDHQKQLNAALKKRLKDFK